MSAGVAEAEPESCQNMFKESCKSKDPNYIGEDRTGTVHGLYASGSRIQKIVTDLEPKIELKAKTAVENCIEQSSQFANGKSKAKSSCIDSAIVFFNLENEPECQGALGKTNLPNGCASLFQKFFKEIILFRVKGLSADDPPNIWQIYGHGKDKKTRIESFDADSDLFMAMTRGMGSSLIEQSGFDQKKIQALDKKIRTEVFPSVRDEFASVIEAMPMSTQAKKALLDKVKTKLKYSGVMSTDPGLSPLFLPNALYDENSDNFMITPGLAQHMTSDFAISFLVAHEVAHMTDPCDNPKYFESSGMKDILACFAKKTAFKIPRGETCRNTVLSEAWADMLGSQIFVKYLDKRAQAEKWGAADWSKGFENTFRMLCHQEFLGKYPDMESRINIAIMANPDVRKKMACTSELKEIIFCSASHQTTDPGAETVKGLSTNSGSAQ